MFVRIKSQSPNPNPEYKEKARQIYEAKKKKENGKAES